MMSCSTETRLPRRGTFTLSPPPPGAFTVPETAPTVLRLPLELRRQLELVVDASYPFEACGVMIGRTEISGSAPQARRTVVVEDVFHARNLSAARAHDRFLLDPEDYLAAVRVARQRGLEVIGFWHSHPDHPARPSATDLEAAWRGHSYLIISTAAFGANVLRSWRLRDGRFFEEPIDQPCSLK